MTISTSDKQKQIWLLCVKKIVNSQEVVAVSKAFETKELCFACCPGLWRTLENNCYSLDFEWSLRQVMEVKGFYLYPINFYEGHYAPA